MAVSAVPAMLNALVSRSTAAQPDRLVLYGFGVTDDANQNILMVGVDDPDQNAAAASSEGSQSMATMGTPRSRDDDVSVTCAALSWNGDADQKAAVEAAFATFEGVAADLRSDPTLGGIVRPGSPLEIRDVRLSMNQYKDGCDALVIFTVGGKVRI